MIKFCVVDLMVRYDSYILEGLAGSKPQQQHNICSYLVCLIFFSSFSIWRAVSHGTRETRYTWLEIAASRRSERLMFTLSICLPNGATLLVVRPPAVLFIFFISLIIFIFRTWQEYPLFFNTVRYIFKTEINILLFLMFILTSKKTIYLYATSSYNTINKALSYTIKYE